MIPLKDSQSPGIFPFWVLAIIGINIYVFFLELTSYNLDAFFYQYGLVPSLVDPSNPATFIPFITSQFLHGGFIHIISNMLFLWVFGDNIEHKFGFILFPILYLLFGVVGGVAQYIVSPDSNIPMIGASGAVAGILGAYFASFPHHSVKTLVPVFGFLTVVDLPASFMLFYWLITQIFAGAVSITTISYDIGGVAYFAHIGGFVVGWIMGKLINNSQYTTLTRIQ